MINRDINTKRLRISDVLLLILLHSVLTILFFFTSTFIADNVLNNTSASVTVTLNSERDQSYKQHPITQLISNDKNILTLLIVFICVVIAAPLIEEFLYRGILTGWLADSTTIYLPQLGFSNKMTKIISVILSLGFPSLYFACLHFTSTSERSNELLFISICAVTLSNLISFVLGVFYLTKIRNFTLEQIGFQINRLRFDILLSLAAAVLIIPPILILTGILRSIFPTFVIDPLPLFFFAIVLGGIFLKTRRLLPCIFIHAILNSTSFIILILAADGKN
ncbi:MAG: CPBP family intramembrane metalloprotease [Planctomycetaceae bacterium]|jgi:membrane protease YdiL (CAAX protease family)|nr:CPBP family intramembrane metalloprotease [Planctomycetaceae bacterium]